MAGRRWNWYTVGLALFCVLGFLAMQSGFRAVRESSHGFGLRRAQQRSAQASLQMALPGHAIAPKLGNQTAKAELGRAAWKLLHTMMARFPDKPTDDESAALRTYLHLFQRLYPCGECAEHFGHLLTKFPPQVSSRSAAAAWACHVHNQVNKSLNKEPFDCANIGDFYDCGCADDEEKGGREKAGDAHRPVTRDVTRFVGKPGMSDESKERLSVNGRDVNLDLLLHH